MQRGKEPITLEEFYRTFEILVREEDMPRRGGVGMGMMSTQDYRSTLENTLRQILVEDYGLVDGKEAADIDLLTEIMERKGIRVPKG
jgi:hypothetical protein